MFKKFLCSISIVVIVLVMSMTSHATPIVALESLDLQQYNNGTYLFTLDYEEAAYESEIGLFNINSYDPLDYDYTTIFSKNQEPGASVSMYVNWTQWDGFYAGVYTSGASDTSMDHLLLGVFGPSGPAPDYFSATWDSSMMTLSLWLDDQIGCIDDNDFNDMRMTMQASPVPEPASMMLLGTGLIGLASISRRKFK